MTLKLKFEQAFGGIIFALIEFPSIQQMVV